MGSLPAPGPILDIRVRWKAGQWALVLAGVLTLVALARPLDRPPEAAWPPWARLAVTVSLGLGVTGTALLSSLRGRGRWELLAFYLFLALSVDAVGQILAQIGWPAWPLMVLLLGAVAVAEPLWIALGLAAIASLLALAEAARAPVTRWPPTLALIFAYAALVLLLNRALLGEQRRLARLADELARLKYGIGQLEESGARPASAARTASAVALRQVSEEGRRQRQGDRAAQLAEDLQKLVEIARRAVGAHAVLHFEVDRERGVAFARASDGPPSLMRDCAIPLGSDPFAFVLERRQAFYATDFKRLLWSLPYYRGEVKVGSLVAQPILTGDVVSAILVADRLETQAFTAGEPELLVAFADLAGEAIMRTRALQSRENLGAEFEAVYPVSRTLATLKDAAAVRRHLLMCARELAPLDAAAVVVTDEEQTRYVVENAVGWAQEFEGREVALLERTWTAWVVRSAEEPCLIDNLAGRGDRMPVLVLDEGTGRAESLLALPLRAGSRPLGALVLTGRRGAFDAAAGRVLEMVCNQAGAVLSTLQLLERTKEWAVKDGLTALYNRRAFNELLRQARAREDRQKGRFALLLLDVDHFKKLNDTFGHPAGDAVLRRMAETLKRHLREGDQAARFGGEEFAVILPATAEAGALHLAERVRAAVANGQVVFEGARLSVTASFGVAVWPEDGRELDALVASADRALYAAKAAGRNCIMSASQAPA